MILVAIGKEAVMESGEKEGDGARHHEVVIQKVGRQGEMVQESL